LAHALRRERGRPERLGRFGENTSSYQRAAPSLSVEKRGLLRFLEGLESECGRSGHHRLDGTWHRGAHRHGFGVLAWGRAPQSRAPQSIAGGLLCVGVGKKTWRPARFRRSARVRTSSCGRHMPNRIHSLMLGRRVKRFVRVQRLTSQPISLEARLLNRPARPRRSVHSHLATRLTGRIPWARR
jgi:hypothetical protein